MNIRAESVHMIRGLILSFSSPIVLASCATKAPETVARLEPLTPAACRAVDGDKIDCGTKRVRLVNVAS